MVEAFHPDMLLGIDELSLPDCLEEVVIDDGDSEISMYALRNPSHFGMVMPIKFMPLRHDDKEQSEIFFTLDR
jgi:hypothetical protein